MNNFILIQNKNQAIDIFLNKEIDQWFLITKDSKPQFIQSDTNHYQLTQNMLIGYESKNSIVCFEEEKASLIIGDPYKLYPNNSISIMEYIQSNTKARVYHKIGGAFCWINIFSKKNKLEVCTDIFGQLPIFYYQDENIFALSTSIDLLLQSLPFIPRAVNIERIIEFIVAGEISDYYSSFFKYIHRLEGNKKLTFDATKNSIDISEYASLEDFRDPSFSFTSQNLKKDIKIALDAATYDKKTAYSLSGGTDSTLLAAVGATISPEKIICYTASTGFGQDLMFARLAASYMDATLHEVYIDHKAHKFNDILELIRINGRPVHIWGNSVGNSNITKKAKDDRYDVLISGSSEHVVSGGVFGASIRLFIHESIKKHRWKLLFDTLYFNHQHKLLSFGEILKWIFSSFTIPTNNQPTTKSKIKGKDFSKFFNPAIQAIRNNLEVEKPSFHIDNLDWYKFYLKGGILQKYTSQTYHNGKISNISVRMPYLDTRLIKYLDNDKHLILHNKHNKQLAKEAMLGIMDPSVIYRKNTHGLKWSSLEFLKRNKNNIINEIKASPFLNNILSKKTLHSLDKPTFRKSILLSLYSVALFDKAFQIEI